MAVAAVAVAAATSAPVAAVAAAAPVTTAVAAAVTVAAPVTAIAAAEIVTTAVAATAMAVVMTTIECVDASAAPNYDASGAVTTAASVSDVVSEVVNVDPQHITLLLYQLEIMNTEKVFQELHRLGGVYEEWICYGQ